jgi:hypothetical protein
LREPTCWCIVMQASLDQQVWWSHSSWSQKRWHSVKPSMQ